MNHDGGERTEQPTSRKLEDAIKKGMIPRSQEVQTVCILVASILALMFFSRETWGHFVLAMSGILGHLHQIDLDINHIHGYSISAFLYTIESVGPFVAATFIGGLLAGAAQSHFQTASEVLNPKLERLDPIAGIQRIFSFSAAVPSLLSLLKLSIIILLSYSAIRNILSDPIFFSVVNVARIAEFMAESTLKILLRITMILAVLASIDYGYQWWRNKQNLMMTKEEVKEEMKSTEGNPHVKAHMRRKQRQISQRKMLMDIPKADVVVTNPTHLAIALRYDPKSMKAPKIVAKGARLFAQRIRETAKQNQIPIVENKPLARTLFKYGKVGGEIPAQLFVAVAEILAWVYRINRYRYYTQTNTMK